MIDMYVAVLFSVLRVRYRAGITTDEMLNLPKSPFIAIAFLESISIVSAMYAGAVLPGPAIPLLYQTFLVWQLVFSSILLKRRYSLNQILGCFLVAAGVVVAVTSGANSGGMFSGVGVMWPMLMIASSAFQAGASIVKESVFVDAATCLKGKSLDIFVVTSFGSGFQVMTFRLLKFLLLKKIVHVNQKKKRTILGVVARNFWLLQSVRIIASRNFKMPISIYVLSLLLPYPPKGVSLSPFFVWDL
ncbi:hypothetical protein MIMGU_mgv1a012637mg [Erythranthe guttata]|uniref:Uncharacterized protein n=1 Tax=Erythranthe guttata TaxID=4155 RepID=A0A022R906_ERYGU|nr:hypothetical protein MIMGU_mgv1a012637mg [Erythranthe guttata]